MAVQRLCCGSAASRAKQGVTWCLEAGCGLLRGKRASLGKDWAGEGEKLRHCVLLQDTCEFGSPVNAESDSHSQGTAILINTHSTGNPQVMGCSIVAWEDEYVT